MKHSIRNSHDIIQKFIRESRQYQLRATKEGSDAEVSNWYDDEETVMKMKTEIEKLDEYDSIEVVKKIKEYQESESEDSVSATLESKCKSYKETTDIEKKESEPKAESNLTTEGVDDPAIFKAVFLAGGPGSGKSFTVGRTALPALGLKTINSDTAFEKALKAAGLEATPLNIFSPQGQEIRQRSKVLTDKLKALYLQGRLGLTIDGTGREYGKIKNQVDELKSLGYDVAMIFVNTDLETALERNRNRERVLPDEVVKSMWGDVQKNIGKFQSIFGSMFIVVDNSNGSNIEKATTSAYKKIMGWVKTPPKSPVAKKWIAQQRGLEEEMNKFYNSDKE